MTKPVIVIDGDSLTIADVVAIARNEATVALSDDAKNRIAVAREVVERAVNERIPVYGLNTGVGSQKDYALGPEDIAAYNNKLIVAHATTIAGGTLNREEVRATLAVQVNMFARGASGVRLELVERIASRLNSDTIPEDIIRTGSVGASDLAPLARLALAIMGAVEGEPAMALQAKEALSLMNSNALSIGQGAIRLHEAQKLIETFDLSYATAMEGFRGNLIAVYDVVTKHHPLPGHIRAAERMRGYLEGSDLWNEGTARFLQDPLSFRCAPQIHGAAQATLDWARDCWRGEMNAVDDNPMVDVESGEFFTHGSMDSTLLTLCMDSLRLGLAKAADVSGERIHKLHWPSFSGLPVGLAEQPGAAAGVQFLNFSHIAESVLAKVNLRANPVLLNSPGALADGVEDTASFAGHAVAETSSLIWSCWKVAAIEMTTGVWAINRRGIPVDTLGKTVASAYEQVLPLLPIGREGEEIFDFAHVIDVISHRSFLPEVL